MAEKPLVRDSGDNGMVPLFDFVNVFVDGVFPETIGDFIDEHSISTISDFGDQELEDYIGLVIGVAICAAVGVLYLVFLPLCGCCYCCCRTCCGACQPHRKTPTPRPSECKKWSCCSILFVLVSCMFAAVACSYVAVSMVNEEFTEDGVINDLKQGLDSMESYLHDSVDDIDHSIFPPLDQTIKEVFIILDDLPETTVTRFAKDTGIDPALYQLDNYTKNLQSLHDNLTTMDSTTTDLNQKVTDMDNDLTAVRGDIEPLLELCVNTVAEAAAECQALLDDAPDLVSDAKYDSLDDVTTSIVVINTALGNNIPSVVSGFVDGFEAIQGTINTTIADDVKEIKKTVGDIEADIKAKFDEFAGDLKNLTVDDIIKELTDIQPDVEYYGSMGTTFLYGISTILFISVLFYLVGIPMGAFGGPQSAKHGANCIMAAVAFTFIFGSLFMLLTMVLFVLGSAVQGGLCRHLTTYDDSMQSLEMILRAEYGRSPPFNLTVRELLDSCSDDQALYTAFRLEDNGFNVSSLLDLDNTELPNYINQLKNISIDIGTITIINDQVNDSVLAIEASTNAIDFGEYLAEVDKGITVIDVEQYANDVKDISIVIQDTNPTLASALQDQADNLESIHNDDIVPMEPLRQTLETASTVASDITTSVSLSKVMGDLTKAQDTLNTEANRMIQDIIGDTADVIYKELKELFDGFITSIEQDIAGCLPAYESLTTVIYGPCVYFLYPYNAVWFTYGWYLAFGFLAIFFATSVVGMFRIKALGRKVSSCDNIPMGVLHTGYQPTNVVHPYGSQAVITEEPPPDYYVASTKRPASAKSTTLSEKLHSSQLQLVS